jgi:Cu(I)/Ag(I) efflux system membrane fusion protein
VTLVPPALEVLVNVEEAHLGQVAEGQTVKLQVAAFPGQTFNGKIASISPTLDNKSRTAAVHIRPDDPEAHLRAGMFAQLSIITAHKRNALLVPNTALLTDGDRPQVVAIGAANTTRRQPVRLGLHDDNVTEVLNGVGEGELVATSGLETLHDGDVVEPHSNDLTAVAQGATN